MANETAFEVELGHSRHFMRVRFTQDRGQVLAFMVQFEVLCDGIYRPAVRFDSQHRRPHRDILDWDGATVRKDWDWEGADLPLAEALNRAQAEVRERWPQHLNDFMRRKPQ